MSRALRTGKTPRTYFLIRERATQPFAYWAVMAVDFAISVALIPFGVSNVFFR